MRPMFLFIKGDRGPRHCLYFKYKGTSYKLKIPFQDTASRKRDFLLDGVVVF
jgi:hypothetical protein